MKLKYNTTEILKPLNEIKYIRIALFNTPDGPCVWRGLVAQTKGNDMYGEIIFLKNTFIYHSIQFFVIITRNCEISNKTIIICNKFANFIYYN